MSGSSGRLLNASYEHGSEAGFDEDHEIDMEDERDEFSAWTREGAFEEGGTFETAETAAGAGAGETDPEIADADQVKMSYFTELKKIESTGLIDIGSLASWEVSSFKDGCGKDQLREDDPDTYWQSDGAQPHTITIHFAKRVAIESLAIFTNYPLDESYTPSEILIRAGTGEHDLQDVVSCHLKEPSGWSFLGFDEILKTFLIKVIVKGNHQNGKDTHIRSMKIFQRAPNKSVDQQDINDIGFEFKTVKMLSESCIR